MNKAFDNFAWKNYPNISTPLEKELLNKINNGLDAVDDRVVTYDTTKFNTSEAQLLVKNVELNEDSGVLKIIHYNGSVSTYSSLLGKVAVNFDFNEETQKMIIYLSGGDRKEVDLSAFITDYEFVDTETIGFQTSADGKVSAIVKEGSIQEKHLRPDYLANVRSEVSKAESASRNADTAAAEAGSNATLSRSWAVGDTGARPGENTDNSKYYYQQSKSIYDNFSQAGTVTGVKGNAESAYRTGNVNLTAANIGAVNKGGDSISGRLNFINYAEVRFVTPDVTTGDHARGISFVDKSGTEIWGGIGVLGRAGEPQYIYIGAGTPHPWNSSYGLSISDTHIKWKNSNLVTENSGTAKEATKATRDGNGSVIADTYAKKEWIYAGFASPQGGKLLIDLRDLSSHQEFLFVLCIAPDYNELEVYKNHLIPWAMLGTSEPYTKIHLHTEGNAHISVYRESGIPTVKVINDSYDYYVYIYAR